MSNDLSNQLRSLNTFEWMARPATTKQICFDAADRIEQLEAALRRYRKETPLGHQPHMIAHEVDLLLEGKDDAD